MLWALAFLAMRSIDSKHLFAQVGLVTLIGRPPRTGILNCGWWRSNNSQSGGHDGKPGCRLLFG